MSREDRQTHLMLLLHAFSTVASGRAEFDRIRDDIFFFFAHGLLDHSEVMDRRF
jgi:hypothetical protein